LTFIEFIRGDLPDNIRHIAALDLPVEVRKEWWERAEVRARIEHKLTMDMMAKLAIAKLTKEVQKVEDSRAFLMQAGLDDPIMVKLLKAMQPELKARLFAATQLPAHVAQGFAPDAEQVTIEQAQVLYLADLRSRVGLPEDGIKPGTYRNAERFLRLALAVTVKDLKTDWAVPAISPTAMLHEVGRDDLVAFKRAWLLTVTAGDIAKRTAANYCGAVQYFLAWCYRRDRIVSRRVPDLEQVFRFTDANPIRIADYTNEVPTIKAILAAASNRVKLYILLALNCGVYQSDIGAIKHSEIETLNAGTFIVRGRVKTSHQNDFRSSHFLWPETAALLKAEMAPIDIARNPHGFALLNEGGNPVYTAGVGGKSDNVTCSYWRVLQGLNVQRKKQSLDPLKLPFKQFRKLGATAMNDLCGEEVQKLYRTASFEGADRFYVKGDFSKLTSGLQAWADKLRADGILIQ